MPAKPRLEVPVAERDRPQHLIGVEGSRSRDLVGCLGLGFRVGVLAVVRDLGYMISGSPTHLHRPPLGAVLGPSIGSGAQPRKFPSGLESFARPRSLSLHFYFPPPVAPPRSTASHLKAFPAGAPVLVPLPFHLPQVLISVAPAAFCHIFVSQRLSLDSASQYVRSAYLAILVPHIDILSAVRLTEKFSGK